jgi:hypothetical protein
MRTSVAFKECKIQDDPVRVKYDIFVVYDWKYHDEL